MFFLPFLITLNFIILSYYFLQVQDSWVPDYKDFDLLFAYEEMAFAHKILGNAEKKDKYLKLGYDSLGTVPKKGDKDYCKSELDKI